MILTADSANLFRPAALLAGAAKFFEYVHPPTERSTFSARLRCFSRKSCLTQP